MRRFTEFTKKKKIFLSVIRHAGQFAGRMAFFLFCQCCVFCLWAETGIKTMAASLEGFSCYEDGDIVGCIGDSITYVDYSSLSYVEILDQYYLSRFPQRRVEFRNLGAGGYKAGDVLNIYDQDPAFQGLSKAIVMLGTNEAILGYSPEDYIGSMEELIRRLKESGLEGEDILILSPPLCDQNCAVNNPNGKPRWAFEGTVLAYMDRLAAMAREQGVLYLNLHTPMAELTEEMQKEDIRNSLTRDAIHPNAAGQRLIAYYILQAQGMGSAPLSGVFVSREGEAEFLGGALTDFYRGTVGIRWTWETEALPVAATEDVTEFRKLFDAADLLYRIGFQAEGLSGEAFYRVLMGEAELGSFTGDELESGIDLFVPEENPQQAAAGQIYSLYKRRHREVINYRNMWIEVMMQRAAYTPEEIQAAYGKWRAADQQLREEIYALAEDMSGNVFQMAVIEEGYSIEELNREAKKEEEARREAEEQARKEAEEEARREAEERVRKEAEEQAQREAEERAREEAEEQARKEAEEAGKAAEIQAGRERMLQRIAAGTGVGAAVVLLIVVAIRKRKMPPG